MKQAICWAGSLIVAACVVASTPAQGKLNDKDTDFTKDAVQCSLLETKLAQYAKENAASEDVKKFAQRMVDDHTKAAADVAALGATKGVAPSITLDKKCQEVCDKLTKLKGAEFDKEYMRHMIEDHAKEIGRFETAAKNLQDPDLKAWALKTLPTLNEHLRMAKDVHAKIEKN
jgi:putative membrane protein